MKMKIVINPKYEQIDSFIKSIPDIFEKEGTTIYKARNELKEYNIDGIHVVVKSFKKPIFINRIIYKFFRPSKAKRAYNNAIELLRLEVLTPEPVAYIEVFGEGLFSRSYYISTKAQFSNHFGDLGIKKFDNKKDILKAYAEFVGDLHNNNILHKDLSKGNILFFVEDEKIRFELIDINRMVFKKVNLKEGCKNFKRTIGDDETLAYIATYYAQYRNLDVQCCVNLIVRYRNRFFIYKNADKITGVIQRRL